MPRGRRSVQSSAGRGILHPAALALPPVRGDKDLDDKYVKESTEAGFINLKGHRTTGGMRASVYNAMPLEGVEKLVAFMKEFEKANS